MCGASVINWDPRATQGLRVRGHRSNCHLEKPLYAHRKIKDLKHEYCMFSLPEGYVRFSTTEGYAH